MIRPPNRSAWPAAALLLFATAPALAQSSFARGTALDWPAVLSGAFLGFLLLPIAYNAAFFVILRERFLLWDTARILTLVALTLCLSSLPLGPLLEAESVARQVAINVLFDGVIALMGPFLGTLLEPGTLPAGFRKALVRLPVAVALTTPAMLLDPCPPAYRAFRDVVLVAILVLYCTALGLALARGSRAARFQSAASLCVLSVCAVSLYHDIVLGRPFGLFLYVLFGAIALEMLLNAASVGDRFMRLKRERDQAQARADTLDLVAHTDPLTGLPNRRGLERHFAQARPRAVAILDIDHFKRINDTFGHDQGDAVIVAVARALAAGPAFAGRLGGEEFALLLSDEAALSTVEALRRTIPVRAAAQVPIVAGPVTASAGVARVTEAMSYAEALKAADLELYAAKAAGRNCSVADRAVYRARAA
ncbi:GGDEF domain-containing protein [Methylobacterium sp. SyP6R]|uniref:GGDEF domain-containing protein n=1 Tax=Methylobacterium sp. SyP6R TaxID=2718876 RepID=UPI001F305FD6|nr:GGDEF domain-containing protein [Methylobacterium sp. SyP6R]MCF4129773.1 GGDEF domain-containing protein [Methylobacterium sp. SyP6R]